MRVLGVEDDPQSRAYIARAVTDDGHAVEVVSDGEAGLKAAVRSSDGALQTRPLHQRHLQQASEEEMTDLLINCVLILRTLISRR